MTPVRARRMAQMSQYVVGEGDDAEARIRQIDELEIRAAVGEHVCSVDTSHLHRDGFNPAAMLAEHPKITIVRAEDHFSDRSALPTP